MKFLMLVCAEEEPDAPEQDTTAQDAAGGAGGDGGVPWLGDLVARGNRLGGVRRMTTRQAGAGEAGVRHGRRRPVAAQDVEGVAGAGPAVAAAAAGAFGQGGAPGLAGSRVPAQPGRDRGVVVADPPGGEAGQVPRRGE